MMNLGQVNLNSSPVHNSGDSVTMTTKMVQNVAIYQIMIAIFKINEPHCLITKLKELKVGKFMSPEICVLC